MFSRQTNPITKFNEQKTHTLKKEINTSDACCEISWIILYMYVSRIYFMESGYSNDTKAIEKQRDDNFEYIN